MMETTFEDIAARTPSRTVETQIAAGQETLTAARALIKRLGVPAQAHAIWIATSIMDDGSMADAICVAVRPSSKWESRVEAKLSSLVEAGKWRGVPLQRRPWPAGDSEAEPA